MLGQFTCPWLLEEIVHSNVKVVRASWISAPRVVSPKALENLSEEGPRVCSVCGVCTSESAEPDAV